MLELFGYNVNITSGKENLELYDVQQTGWNVVKCYIESRIDKVSRTDGQLRPCPDMLTL